MDFEDIERIKKIIQLKRFILGFPDRNSVVYWGYDYGHGYGHRKGRGNRWDHEIDDLILDYMLEVDEIYHYYFDDSNLEISTPTPTKRLSSTRRANSPRL